MVVSLCVIATFGLSLNSSGESTNQILQVPVSGFSLDVLPVIKKFWYLSVILPQVASEKLICLVENDGLI